MRSLVFASLCFLSSCVTLEHRLGDEEELTKAWNGKLYIGDPVKKSLLRAQSASEIKCSDEAFSEMICMSHTDFKDLMLELSALRRQVKM